MTRRTIVPLLLALALPAVAAPDPGGRVTLPCGRPAALAVARPLGLADPGAPMERMVLVLDSGAAARARLGRFLAALQDPASPDFHRWLTPDQFGERFGPARVEVERLTRWLEDEGFTVEAPPRGRMSLTFSGTAAQVQRAFMTPIVRYRGEGLDGTANAVPPSMPRDQAGAVVGLLSLHGGSRRALNGGFRPVPPVPKGQGLSILMLHFLAPGDAAAIYNTRPLYRHGIDGAGVKVAIIGRTHPGTGDFATFRKLYGLPPRPPAVVINGPDPGDQGSAENGEADLDVEWSGALAPGADIQLVASKSTATTDGVDLSARYAVERNEAAVMSLSFGECEKSLGASGVAFYRNLWAQAAAQGITVVVASGDSGPAGCDPASSMAGTGAAVSGLASTPDNVAVGGTQFGDGTGKYWAGSNRSDLSSALGYVPEAAWNESGSWLTGFGIWAGGGGPSAAHAKPAWQLAPGVPEDGHRDTPDVALAAATANGYLIQTGGWPSLTGGTSCAAPSFAGILALLVQKTGERQGNVNPALYRLAAAQFAGTGPQVFHDIITGNNTVAGTAGYACAPGYDLATGLGSVDAQALLDAWAGGAPRGE